MLKFSFVRLLTQGVCSAGLLCAFAAPGHTTATVVSVPSQPTSTTPFTFTTDPNGPTSLTFELTPESGPFVPVKVTASDFKYTGNWQLDASSLLSNYNTDFVGHYGATLSGSQISTVSLYNNGSASTTMVNYFLGIPIGVSISSPTDGELTTTPITSSITLPFTSIGTGGGFDLSYYDAPTSTGFEVLQGTTPIISGMFDANGKFIPSASAVPEASPFLLFGLGALPLVALAHRRRGVSSPR